MTAGERSGLTVPPPVWEQHTPTAPHGQTIAPRQRHVWAFVLEEWVQALAVELRRGPDDDWLVRVAYVLDAGVVHEEWIERRLVRVPD